MVTMDDVWNNACDRLTMRLQYKLFLAPDLKLCLRQRVYNKELGAGSTIFQIRFFSKIKKIKPMPFIENCISSHNILKKILKISIYKNKQKYVFQIINVLIL